jgi:hypothetical protein
MAGDWEQLSDEWEGINGALVAEVDCAAEGKPLCDASGVRGFPTLKYGDPTALEDYQGQRDYDAMAKFAEENIKPMCSPANLDICDDAKKAEIEALLAETVESLDAKIAFQEKRIEEAEETFKAAVKELQETYTNLQEAKEDTMVAVTKSGLGLMKAVKAHAVKSSGSDEL